MKLNEMQTCAKETLAFFIQTMPDVPFGIDDIDIIFASKKDMVERFKAFAEQFAPERLQALSDHHFDALETHIFGNAITGRKRSAAILRRDNNIGRDNLRRIVFHELMHIYCAKTEMDSEHFIDVYGSGHTPDPEPEDRVYDGQVSAGYFVWSEFIAEYFATIKTAPHKHYFSDVVETVFDLLGEIIAGEESAKVCFAMMSAYVLSCEDAQDTLDRIDSMSDGSPTGIKAMAALRGCLTFLYEHLQSERPCKITEEFIHALGSKYLTFVIMNSIYLGVLGQI